MIFEKLITPLCNLHGSYIDQKKATPSLNGINRLCDLSSEQREILTNNCLQENLTSLYRTLASRRVDTQSEIIADDAAKEYWECFQDFADTLYATIVQLEEYGYEITDVHPIRGLNKYFQTECARVRQRLDGIEEEGQHRTLSAARIMELKLQAIPELLENTDIQPYSAIDLTDIPALGFQKTNTALKHQLNQLSGLEEAVYYDNNYEDFDLKITRPILTNAHNVVRAYELETQQELDIRHPLKRLASFSHATDNQLAQWIASADQNMHPVYATINNVYYDKASESLVQLSEDHSLEDEADDMSLSRTGLTASGYASDYEEDELWHPRSSHRHRLMRRPASHARSYQETIGSSDDEDDFRLDSSKPKRRRRHPQSRSVKSSEDLRQHRYTRKHLPSADLRDKPMIYSEEE